MQTNSTFLTNGISRSLVFDKSCFRYTRSAISWLDPKFLSLEADKASDFMNWSMSSQRSISYASLIPVQDTSYSTLVPISTNVYVNAVCNTLVVADQSEF